MIDSENGSRLDVDLKGEVYEGCRPDTQMTLEAEPANTSHATVIQAIVDVESPRAKFPISRLIGTWQEIVVAIGPKIQIATDLK